MNHFVISILLIFSFSSPVLAADSYAVNDQQTVQITEHGVCRKVFNDIGNGRAVFVPTKTAGEWADFRNNAPSFIVRCDCTSQIVGGFCWRYGAANQSCTTVCTGFDGYNNATATYAGSAGSNANCQAVLAALGAAGAAITAEATAGGCNYDSNKGGRRRGTNATTAASANADKRRACACNL